MRLLAHHTKLGSVPIAMLLLFISAGPSMAARNSTVDTLISAAVLLGGGPKLEKALGELGSQSLEEHESVTTDPTLNARAKNIVNRLLSKSARQDLDYEVKVLNKSEVNAYALPGGHIYVNEGLLRLPGVSDNEIAYVLGHELAHTNKGHGVRQMKSSIMADVVVGAITKGKARLYGEMAQQLFLSGRSRKDELEADATGFDYAVGAGYDPAGGLAFMRRLETLSTGRKEPFQQFFATHPPSHDRAEILKNKMLAQEYGTDFKAPANVAALGESSRYSGPPRSKIGLLTDKIVYLGDDRSGENTVWSNTFYLTSEEVSRCSSAKIEFQIKAIPRKDPIVCINRSEIGRAVAKSDAWETWEFPLDPKLLRGDAANLIDLETFMPDMWRSYDDCEVKQVWLVSTFSENTTRPESAWRWALYRTNLHSHTVYSDWALVKDIRLYKGKGLNPWTAAEEALKNKLDALAVSDHGEQLSIWPWTEVNLGMDNGEQRIKGVTVGRDALSNCLVGKKDMSDYLHITSNTATSNGGVTLIKCDDAGDESWDMNWGMGRSGTSAYLVGKWEDTYGKARAFNKQTARGLPFVLLRAFEWSASGANGYHVNVIGSDDICRARGSRQDLFDWISKCYENNERFVCQFNHPTTNYNYDEQHYNLDCPNGNMLDVVNGRLDWSAVSPEVKAFALMEVSSQGIKVTSLGDAKDKLHSNEYWYREALRKGWRLAPAHNEDNHDPVFSKPYGATDMRTGVWLLKASSTETARQSLMSALLDRRVFASEIRDAELRFWTDASHAMGDIVVGDKSGSGKLSLSISATPGDLSIYRVEELQFVEIREKNGSSQNTLWQYGRSASACVKDVKEEKAPAGIVTALTIRAEVPVHADTICYYAKVRFRVKLTDGMAVTAPIWVSSR